MLAAGINHLGLVVAICGICVGPRGREGGKYGGNIIWIIYGCGRSEAVQRRGDRVLGRGDVRAADQGADREPDADDPPSKDANDAAQRVSRRPWAVLAYYYYLRHCHESP